MLRLIAMVAGLAVATPVGVMAQSNLGSQGNSVEYDPNAPGLPEQATLNGKVTKLDDLSPVIFLNRTKAVLNCAAGSMQAELKFNEPFFGLVYADFERNSACRLVGKGALSYRIELPLKGCGTRQDPQRVFTNNIVVRFHPDFQIDGDETITIVCRYPPPVAPPPLVPARILETPSPPVAVAPPLEGFQIMLIICAILFLSLLLLGLGCSYYCLRRRHVQVVRRAPFVTDTESESSKLSNPSLGPVSLFEGLKIPRAHTAVSLSSSEQHLVSEASDTLPSDYPSESPSSAHSEVEEVETRSLRRPSTLSSGSFEPQSKFDVQVRVKRSPPSPPAPSPPGSDIDSQMTIQEQKLTTILEQLEDSRSMMSVDSGAPAAQTSFTYVPELHPPPAKYAATPPVYSRIVRRQQVVRIQPPPRRPSITTMSTEEANLRTITDTQETTTVKREAMMEPLEPPVVPERRPEITSHVVDDVFLRTITEKKTFEDIERHRRQVKESHAKPPPANPKWDVVIRNYPAPEAEMLPEPTTDWESYSETSSASGYPITPVLERPLERHITERHVAQQNLLSEQHRSSVDIERTYRSSLTIPPPDPAPPNWDVLIRVLDQPEQEPIKDVDDLSTSEIAEESTLTTEDKEKWRQIITTESMLRSMLTEATVKEDYERIRRDRRYEKLFEPAKWDVIIRVLTPPERLYDSKGGPANQRYRRKTDWDTRSRRSSLPTLYEYDSDGTSSARTLTTTGALDLARSRRTSRSSMRSDMDVRSMTEVMVDYSRPDKADTLSDVSGPGSFYRGVARKFYDDDDLGHMASEEDDYGPVGLGLARSLSQPSLARSASEFTEHWAVVRGQSPTSPRSSAYSSRGPAPLPPIQPLRSSELFAEQSSSSQQETSGAAHMRSFQSSYQTREQRGWFESDNRSEEGFK